MTRWCAASASTSGSGQPTPVAWAPMTSNNGGASADPRCSVHRRLRGGWGGRVAGGGGGAKAVVLPLADPKGGAVRRRPPGGGGGAGARRDRGRRAGGAGRPAAVERAGGLLRAYRRVPGRLGRTA